MPSNDRIRESCSPKAPAQAILVEARRSRRKPKFSTRTCPTKLLQPVFPLTLTALSKVKAGGWSGKTAWLAASTTSQELPAKGFSGASSAVLAQAPVNKSATIAIIRRSIRISHRCSPSYSIYGEWPAIKLRDPARALFPNRLGYAKRHSAMKKPIPIIEGLSEIATRYQGFIVDLWGVLHDGVTAFPEAVDAVRRAKRAGVKVLILSNAPRRASEVATRCREMGIDESCYDALLSSGEDTWQHLSQRPDAWYRKLGRRCFHMGPDRDQGMRDGLDLDFPETPQDADFVLNTGAHLPEDSVQTYQPVIDRCLALGLPMVCANPDLEVIRGGRREICAGAVAARYEELGGQVRYHGKPHPPIYAEAMQLLGLSDPAGILCIGDSLRTDVAGARAGGMASLWVLDGIHAESLHLAPGLRPDPARLEASCEAYGQRPDFAIPWLRWQD